MEQNIYMFGKTIYVTPEFIKVYGVDEQTIWNNTSEKSKSRTKWYTSKLPGNKKNILIAYDSISEKFIKRFHIGSYQELKNEYEKNYSKKAKEINFKGGHIEIVLDLEYHSWTQIKDIYKNEFLEGEKLEIYCKTHSVLSKILELIEYNYTIKELFPYYCKYDDLVFRTNSYHYFCNKISKIRESQCIEDVTELLLHLREKNIIDIK